MSPPSHRVVIPVHIPEKEGYFGQLDQILELCLDSLQLASEPGLRVTVIANACAPDVVTSLTHRAERGLVDQLIVYSDNRGKVDALLGVAPRCVEDIVTLSDGDVLFRRGWQAAVERVFHAFPEAGWVAPVTALLPRYETTATLAAGWVKNELRYGPVVRRADLLEFAQSVGDPHRFGEEQLRQQLHVERGGEKALVGAGHFVASLRREAARRLALEPTKRSVSGGSELEGLDRPIDEAGFWRLSTTSSYALHMGNVPEQRFEQELDALRAPSAAPKPQRQELPPIQSHWSAKLLPRARQLMARAGYRRATGSGEE